MRIDFRKDESLFREGIKGLPRIAAARHSWHWWTAGDTAEDLPSLTKMDVVSIELNEEAYAATITAMHRAVETV